ncbi:MAG: hypothetical protein K0Q59_5448, partial [Paenibacillus sp.]|nr:hypothetical protein [Paenibacillus sp.]
MTNEATVNNNMMSPPSTVPGIGKSIAKTLKNLS